jgi:hypothetical protein
VRLHVQSEEYHRYLDAASVFWRNNTLPSDVREPGWILVEAMSQDIRVTLRNLSVANALRRIFPAPMAVFTGTDEHWYEALWSGFDVSLVERMAKAYGADAVFDIHDVITGRIASNPLGDGEYPELTLAGRRIPETGTAIAPDDLDAIVDATTCRILRIPRTSAGVRGGEVHRSIQRRSLEFSRTYDALFTELRPAALITSHVDYNQWGLAVETATRMRVPVVHVQSTGTLKAYTAFPEEARGAQTFRAELTHQIGDFFNRRVYPNRDVIRRSAELIAWRSKGNLGRPSWWRRGTISSLEVQTPVERDAIRAHALDRYGFDRAKPVVTVFNHAISDALGTNVEHFDDLGAWFEETAAYAAERPDANWLFLDHPSQKLYDLTGFFNSVAGTYAHLPHMVFRPSITIAKNILWSLTDVGVTVRGSVSNELPAYGIPAIQAGWSEWSECGISKVAVDREDYWKQLDATIAGIAAGEPQVDPDQIERARLWTWLYRSGGDVPSPLVQHWDMGDNSELMEALRVTMEGPESDGDPLFASVRRMWTRREPLLTRFDMRMSRTALADEMWGL